ncbi:hypothetical protein REPUB_Repub06bG0145200 [Reevesia pubescens]
MTRKKVKLAWIANDSARRASLKKRRLGLMKKVSELTTLCGTEACLIIYSPEENEPMVWPSHAEVHRQLAAFSKMPELERMKKMMNQETYLKDKVNKSQEQLRKNQRRNKEIEMGHLMHQIHQGKGLDELTVDELGGLAWLMEEKMKEIRKRIEFFEQVPAAPADRPPHGDVHVPLPPKDPENDLTANIGGASAGLGGDHGRITAESLLLDQWFADMVNNNKFKSAASSNSNMRSDMGLPYYPFAGFTPEYDLGLGGLPFGGSSSIAAEMGPPPLGNFRGPTSDMGLPPLSFRPLHGGATDMGLQPHGSTVAGGSSNFGPFGPDMGMELHLFGHVGSSSAGSEFGNLPFGVFGGGSSSTGGTGSDMGMGMLFDGKIWPNNLSP